MVRELEKIWDPRFIHDSYASRKGKGIHVAVDRLQGFMQKVTRSGKRAGFFLQLDVRSFFMSIDKRILFSLFDRDPKTSELLRALLSILIFHDSTTDYHFKGDRKLLYGIPPHKSLFKVGPNKGLPIGNLTSRFFANVYLNELDQFVKHGLRCRFYLRYVDDFILLSESEKVLLQWREEISGFLHERLALSLKGGDRVRRVSEGADFLGYITRPGYRLVRRRVGEQPEVCAGQDPEPDGCGNRWKHDAFGDRMFRVAAGRCSHSGNEIGSICESGVLPRQGALMHGNTRTEARHL